jgi:hypothetical protein
MLLLTRAFLPNMPREIVPTRLLDGAARLLWLTSHDHITFSVHASGPTLVVILPSHILHLFLYPSHV